ncbi:heme o synthase [Aestuariirhabdus litorea]|uniref:Protoheme IX farnesyltransferase n=1 Tax=Aestuariirhabdus litorea TaxID=2528527 RepID=A0A3P3VIR6_9GAMM|nr:heme o synthase [Aestuariirhabdus litorea]RRJ82562.1 protoheme IX farnesyltransferase [Aestuariirhabdus litorea]RWW92722.1 protoheme IX farnesyltransferase [Endozoicomonadaceae bacterium GTF-13]
MSETLLLRQVPSLWRRYLVLCKPKVVSLILFTAVVGMLLSTPGMIPVDRFIMGSLGIALAAASGAAINHWFDQRIDAVMERTQGRPLPQGEIAPWQALTFAIGLGLASMLLLTLWVNTLTAVLSLLSIIGYAVIYTVYLKRRTPHNIVLGGIAGAAPPVLGWVAITGEVSTEAFLLFLIIFTWTPPHFWALAIRRRAEYARAGLPMLPVTHGVAFTKLNILIYTLMLLAVTLLPFAIKMSGLLYLAAALVLGGGFIVQAWSLYRSPGDELAMKTFGYSIFYLSALFAALLLDHYLQVLLSVPST